MEVSPSVVDAAVAEDAAVVAGAIMDTAMMKATKMAAKVVTGTSRATVADSEGT